MDAPWSRAIIATFQGDLWRMFVRAFFKRVIGKIGGWFIRRSNLVGFNDAVAIDKVLVREREALLERRANRQADPWRMPDLSIRSEALANQLDKLWAEEQDALWRASESPSWLGVALSGGGIRSATFNLGALEALAQARVITQADYLSTVSGGGYVGGLVTALLSSSKPPYQSDFPINHERGVVENAIFRHLRSYSRYLAPGGLLHKVRLGAIVLRGAIINSTILFYGLLAVAGLYICLMEVNRHYLAPHVSGPFALTVTVSGFVLLYFLASAVLSALTRSNWRLRDKLTKSYARCLLLIAGVAFFELQPYALTVLDDLGSSDASVAPGQMLDIGLAASPFLLALGAALRTMFSAQIQKMSVRLFVTIIGGIGPLLLWCVFLAIVMFLQDMPWWNVSQWVVLLQYLLPGLCYLAFVNINETSLHRFYRDRLSKAYLLARENGVFEHVDRLKLTKIWSADSEGPYHLINASLNITAENGEGNRKYEVGRVRNADFFLLSRFFVGCHETGYRATEAMEECDENLDLGTALAISGAALAPNMGTATVPTLVPLMTLLNLRLGYWLPNPGRCKPRRFGRVTATVSPLFLIFELLSRIKSKTRNVNVTDGGHIENLGIYELLRRECRFIVCCDSEQDKDFRFSGLAAAVRMARTDLGIDVDFDTAQFDAIAAGRQHYALGTIRYSKGRQGKMLYLKASLTGNENIYIKKYKAENKEFPHETTANQFFSEEQFEAYRALGYHVVHSAFERGDPWEAPATFY